MSTLEELAARALARGASYPAIEWEKRWINWLEMGRVADDVNRLLEVSGADRRSPIALVPRNRPAALAALVGLIARGRHIQMIHAYQSMAGIARDIARLRPAAVVALEDVFSEEVRSVLVARGIAGIGLTEVGAGFHCRMRTVTRRMRPAAASSGVRCIDQRHHGTRRNSSRLAMT